MRIAQLLMLGMAIMPPYICSVEGDQGGGGGGQGTQEMKGADGGTQAIKPPTDPGAGQQKAVTGATIAPVPPPKPLPPDDDDDDEVEPKADDAGMLGAMSLKSFKRRVGRASKKMLRGLFGTDDADDIVKKWKELPELKAYKEKSETDKLSERERLQKERDDALKAKDAAEGRAAAAEEQSGVRETTATLRGHVLTVVDKHNANDLLDKLARAITKGDVQTMKEAKTWCTDYVAAHPVWAKAAPTTAGTDAEADAEAEKEKTAKAKAAKDAPVEKPAPRKVPLSTSRRPGAPSVTAGAGNADPKTMDFRTASKADVLRATGYKI